MHALVYGLVALAAVWALAVGVLLLLGRRLAARKIFRLVPDLLALFSGLARDPRVPRGSKILLWFAAAWVASPIDLIPEFIPVLGPLDDAVIAALVLRHLVRVAGRDVVAEHWRGDPETLDQIMRIVRADRIKRRPIGEERW
jgi:uncharacterized membrane protein YkvA (DUF1232 family)